MHEMHLVSDWDVKQPRHQIFIQIYLLNISPVLKVII